MKLTPNDFAILATLVLAVIVMAHRDDPRAWEWIKAQWSRTVGAWFAKRRTVSSFTASRPTRFRVNCAPSGHCQRHLNTGNWT
jgi:hypothetical protein